MIIPKNWGEMPFTARLDFLIRVILLLFGAGLAINQFLFNRSIWGDEGYLALNIIDKSYFELLGPLDHYQVSPPLFLILSKFFFRIIPQPEMALRFLPLIFFISSLVLLFFLTQRLFETPFTRIATLSLFSFSHAHIYFATEFKQYIGDVFFVLLGIYLVLFPFRFQKVKFFSLGLYGAFFCLFSHSSFLFLPTLTLYLIVEDYSEDSRENLKPIFFLGAIWLSILMSIYFLQALNHPSTDFMNSFWSNRNGFLNFYPFSEAIDFFQYHLKSFFLTTVFFSSVFALNILIFLGIHFFGIFQIYLKGQTKLYILFFLPFFLNLFLSAFDKIPIAQRTVLYASSLFFLFSGFAIEWLETQVNRHQKLLPNVAFLILIIPLFLSYRFFTKPFILERSSKINKYPFQREEIKPALEYLAKNSQKNQKLYIPYLSKCSFLFYQKTNFNYGGLEFELMPLLTGRYRTDRMDTNLVKPYFEKINGKIWVLLSHTTNTECKYVEKYIGKRGKGGLVFDTTNTFLYFYEIPVSSTQIASK